MNFVCRSYIDPAQTRPVRTSHPRRIGTPHPPPHPTHPTHPRCACMHLVAAVADLVIVKQRHVIGVLVDQVAVVECRQ